MMNARALLAVTLLAATPLTGHAGWQVGGGVEYFEWTERDLDGTQIVKESGPMYQANLGWTQDKASGALFAYRGRVYGGEVDYNGALFFDPSVKVKDQTQYTGTSQEGQLRFRLANSWSNGLDFLVGAGMDFWERKLSDIQKERFFIGFARLGLDVDRSDSGWLGGLGIKYPFYTYEQVYTEGFSPKPIILKPGKEISAYAQLGYQFQGNWRLIAYFDSFRFSRSATAETSFFGSPTFEVFQPESTLYRGGLRVEWAF